MSDDTIYRMKPNRVDRVHEADDRRAHEPDEALTSLADECEDWEEDTTEVTRLREELEDRLERSEQRLVGTASKLEMLRQWFADHPLAGAEG